MRTYTTVNQLKTYLQTLDSKVKLGFVPTMGALHNGHLSLLKSAKSQCDIVVVSIFVNPTQFDKQEDLDHYPSTIDKDLKILELNGCDATFVPSIKDMYPDTVSRIDYDFDGLDKVMEGAHRQGHFAGVGTIVKKLFDIVQPHDAFFGEKDFQQLQIVRKLVEKEQLPIKIISVPIFRENDGLAMSSRNVRLTSEHRDSAPFIYRTLQQAKIMFQDIKDADKVINWVYKEFESHQLLELEYFSIAEESTLLPIKQLDKDKKYRGFIAVFAGEIRLIDNLAFY